MNTLLCDTLTLADRIRMSENGGVALEGGSLHDGFGGFGGSGEHLALLLLVLQNLNAGQRANHDSFGGLVGYAVLVVT